MNRAEFLKKLQDATQPKLRWLLEPAPPPDTVAIATTTLEHGKLEAMLYKSGTLEYTFLRADESIWASWKDARPIEQTMPALNKHICWFVEDTKKRVKSAAIARPKR